MSYYNTSSTSSCCCCCCCCGCCCGCDDSSGGSSGGSSDGGGGGGGGGGGCDGGGGVGAWQLRRAPVFGIPWGLGKGDNTVLLKLRMTMLDVAGLGAIIAFEVYVRWSPLARCTAV